MLHEWGRNPPSADAQRCSLAFFVDTLWSTLSAVPGSPMTLIAWSMPPDSVPTYRSQVQVNSATSC